MATNLPWCTSTLYADRSPWATPASVMLGGHVVPSANIPNVCVVPMTAEQAVTAEFAFVR